MIIKKLPLILCLLVSCLQAYAQPALKWAAFMGTANGIKPTAMAVSSRGEVVTAGNFYGTNDFNPGVTVTSRDYMTGGGTFVTKLDSNRNLIWALQVGNTTADSVFITDIDIDTVGNIYVTGSYKGYVDVAPSGQSWFIGQNPNIREVFFCKLTQSGAVVWAQNFEGGTGSSGTSIKADNQGSLYVTGYFGGTAYVTWGGVNIASSGQDMFLIKTDTAGTMQWIKTSSGNAKGYAVDVDNQSNAYVSGTFSGTTDFSPSVTGGSLTATNLDAFVARFNANGTLAWANPLAGSGNEEARSLAVDKASNVLIGGSYTTSVDCDPGTTTFTIGGSLPPQGCYGYFLTKLSNTGNFVWAVSPAASGTCNPELPLALDGLNNIYVTGDFGDTLDFDPGTGTYNLAPNGPIMVSGQPVLNPDVFVSRINENGSFGWARRFGSAFENERGETIAVTQNGRINIAGTFSDTVDFDPSVHATNLVTGRLSNVPLKGMFIQRLWQCPGIQNTLTETACFSYPFANNVYTSSGIYPVTLPTAQGCDSIVTLNLTITKIDTGITQNSSGLTSKEAAGSYQWINCLNRLNPNIPGATNATFATSISGLYAVVISKNGCTDTSTCYFLVGTGVSDINFGSNISLYPNPTTESATINFGSMQQRVEIEVSNIAGQLVQKKTVTNTAAAELEIQGSKGIYIIKLTADSGRTAYMKIVKE
jgi:hypothetical protein